MHEAWQYSSEAGCYLENSFLQAMPYPPVVQKGSSFAQTAVAGEYLQRLCSGYLSRVRGDARDEEVKKQAAMMVVPCYLLGEKRKIIQELFEPSQAVAKTNTTNLGSHCSGLLLNSFSVAECIFSEVAFAKRQLCPNSVTQQFCRSSLENNLSECYLTQWVPCLFVVLVMASHSATSPQAYDDKEAAPRKSEAAPVLLVVPTSPPAEESSSTDLDWQTLYFVGTHLLQQIWQRSHETRQP